MKAASNDLFAAAQELLAAADASLADSIAGQIDYKAIWPGVPAFDCAPALHVSLGAVAVADTLPGTPSLAPMQRIVTTGEVNIQVMAVTILRCVAVMGQQGENVVLPPAVNITADAQETYGDLWAVWNGLKNRHRAGTLFQDPSGRREFSLDPAIPVRTAGGVGGSIVNVRFQIPGYKLDAA